MNRSRALAAILAAVTFGLSTTSAGDVPANLAPFEDLVGGWKGTAIPAANRLKGWQERHVWGWKFLEGKPAALTFRFDGSKVLTSGTLAFDPETKSYRLDGKGPEGTVSRLAGTLDESGRTLVLKPVGPDAPDDAPQVTLRLNENRIRYTLWVDRKVAGAPRPKREIEIGLTKDGEALAAGGAAGGGGPKCVVTGGAATLSVIYQGKSYPLCCSGCRDEFNESPEKYVAKAAQASSPPTATAPEAPAPQPSPPQTKEAPTAKTKTGAPDAAVKAASWLRLGQTLEKSGKKAGALEYYQRILKETPEAPEAKVAAERVKAIQGK